MLSRPGCHGHGRQLDPDQDEGRRGEGSRERKVGSSGQLPSSDPLEYNEKRTVLYILCSHGLLSVDGRSKARLRSPLPLPMPINVKVNYSFVLLCL
jgi:hypothetical protein